MNILSRYRFLLLLPNAHPSRTNETARETHKVLKSYPPKLFFFFSPKGDIKTEKKWRKLQVQWTLRRKSPLEENSAQKKKERKKQYPYSIKIPSYTHPSLSDQRLRSPFFKRFKPEKGKEKKQKKRERPGVRGSHCVFFQASCASLRVGFFQCCWQWGEALWWLMLLRAPVWCSNCLSRCSPGLKFPARRWTRPSQESLLSTAVRPLENKSETQEHQSIKWNTLVKEDN